MLTLFIRRGGVCGADVASSRAWTGAVLDATELIAVPPQQGLPVGHRFVVSSISQHLKISRNVSDLSFAYFVVLCWW